MKKKNSNKKRTCLFGFFYLTVFLSLDIVSIFFFFRSQILCNNMNTTSDLSLSTIPKRRNRTTPKQIEILERYFQDDDMPEGSFRNVIAKVVNMPSKSVHIWQVAQSNNNE